MNHVFWWDGVRNAGGIWTSDMNSASDVAAAMSHNGWKVVWTIHSSDRLTTMPGYEEALAEWREEIK